MSEGKKVEFEHCRDVATKFLGDGGGHYSGCAGIRETFAKCDMGCDEYRMYEQVRDLVARERQARWEQALDAALAICLEQLKNVELMPRTSSPVRASIVVAERIRALKERP